MYKFTPIDYVIGVNERSPLPIQVRKEYGLPLAHKVKEVNDEKPKGDKSG